MVEKRTGIRIPLREPVTVLPSTHRGLSGKLLNMSLRGAWIAVPRSPPESIVDKAAQVVLDNTTVDGRIIVVPAHVLRVVKEGLAICFDYHGGSVDKGVQELYEDRLGDVLTTLTKRH